MSLYWLCYRHNNQISVVIEPAPSLVHARMRAATISRAIRTPTTNDVTGCRLGLTSFDLAPFCAAPIPNQKRSLSIDPCLALNEGELTAAGWPRQVQAGI